MESIDEIINIFIGEPSREFIPGHMVLQQQCPGLTHPAVNQIIHGRDMVGLPENAEDMRLAQVEVLCDILHGDPLSGMRLQVEQDIVDIGRAGEGDGVASTGQLFGG